MAKGIRSKIKKRWRVLKRNHLQNVVRKPQFDQLTDKVNATLMGIDHRKPQPKNAFLYPDDPSAEFPKFKPAPIIDLRSSAIPGSGLQWRGANRKKQNGTITAQFRNYETMGQQEQGVVVQQVAGEQREEVFQKVEKIREQKVEGSGKIKKSRKSKLRKTIVF